MGYDFFGRLAPVGLEVGKTKQGGKDEKGFVRSSNRSNLLPGRVRFARSGFCQRLKDFQGEVCWLPRRGRCRQTGNEVALDQGQECRRDHQSVVHFSEAR
jgi:hypothetical protein